MEQETIKIVKDFLKVFNETFEVVPKLSDDEEVVNYFEIVKLKNNGAEFTYKVLDMFKDVMKVNHENYDIIFDEVKGLVVAKKVVRTEYEIEDT